MTEEPVVPVALGNGFSTGSSGCDPVILAAVVDGVKVRLEHGKLLVINLHKRPGRCSRETRCRCADIPT